MRGLRTLRSCRRRFSTAVAGPPRCPEPEGTFSRKLGAAFFLTSVAGLGCLGTWQLSRKSWKEGLIEERKKIIEAPAQPISTLASDNGKSLKYRQASVNGFFDYSKQIRLGPRKNPDISDPAVQSIGYFLVTPLTTDDGTAILVNRGWVDRDCLKADPVQREPQEGPVEVRGVLTSGEKRNKYLESWQPTGDKKEWIVLDACAVEELAALSPIVKSQSLVLEAAAVGSGSGSQLTRKSPEEHMTFYTSPETHLLYAATWYSLGACLLGVAFVRFRKKPPTAMEMARAEARRKIINKGGRALKL